MERIIGEVVFDDYPDDKYAGKVKWWKTQEGLDIIRGWRSRGFSIKDIVNKMGIDPRTFRAWRKKYPEFEEVLAVGKDTAIARVEHSLYERATGYDYIEEVWELVEGEMIKVREFRKHIPPDVKAIMHFLYNRDPQHWRALQEPLESTQYTEVVKNILVAMKDVAETEQEKLVEIAEAVQD